KLAELAELKLQNQWLLEQLGLAKKRQFGASSERLQEWLMDQLSLMANEAEAYAYGTKNATAEQVAVKAHARKR
ncbi:transposase, partial [Intestinimonas butyriciproducens]|uniref:IS66 family transposase n=1 Tax=Intestinimonas butyriciproducens TaxID=1297617 RepID=UPI00195920EF|nr:IS66 family transposase [Intestinimonas butyriciproducens]